ncbi:protein adenylyltransferase SelO [Alteribacter keqinensis]|uniref:Protein nucleotidyltransferase YdiU n=1 Tax=Alteribacter keqinensis TaxID=2483800 RepID=A0A3M7TP35_9BACI|nr:YdiU family protein [Alteribacter keqinensis]RNA66777.1 YdiU family protein [Alteribacter keqinensis]
MTKSIDTGWNLDNSYARLPESFFSLINPNPVADPELVVLNTKLAATLGLNAEELKSKEGINILAGNDVPDGSVPIAQAYAGHQFGNFTMLGDGRALLFGEQISPDGERVDVQLKGSGPTPFSRGGDGRAALGPMLREYIISEAMHALGIPTSRSLAVVATGEPVYRETELPGAVLTRTAASHLRFGTFQYSAGVGKVDDLRTLADYAIERHYPHIKDHENQYFSFLEEVMKDQASLVAKWQHIGFIHGVMNTDNMTISGETIDYGPCAFMDTYDPKTVFSSIDVQGRYAYGNQPYITGWNLSRFSEALLPLLHNDEEEAVKLAQAVMADFSERYKRIWLDGMRKKLGLLNEEKEDESLVEQLLSIMQKNKADYTNTFRALSFDQPVDELSCSGEFNEWYRQWQARLNRQEGSKESSRELMQQTNPAIIPRNHKVEEALEAAGEGNFSVMLRLLDVLSNPYTKNPDKEFTNPPEPSSRPYRTFCGT